MARGRVALAVCLLAGLAAVASVAHASDPPFPAAAQGLHDLPARWLGVAGARVAIGPGGLVAAAEGVRAVAVPAGGGTRLSPTSSPAWLLGDVDEWAALSFVEGTELRTGAAGSRGPDWAGRGAISELQFVAGEQGAVAIGRLRDLKIRTELAVIREVPGVMVTVILSNRSAGPLRDVTYAREWRQPGGVARAQWSLGTLLRRQSASLTFWYLPAGVPAPGGSGGDTFEASALALPVTLWVHPDHPYGLAMGETNGVSWGDFDADGFPDLFACQSANLWRNLGGANWTLAANFTAQLPKATIRYGASFGDWDADGYPDLATEPRKVLTGDTCLHLLHNLGGTGAMEDAATSMLDVQGCLADGETACWGDVDGDGQLDLFLPAYPAWVLNGAGSFLWRNLGPGSSPRFQEVSTPAGVEVPPPDTARPEGAQLCDVDADGDPDLYSNGVLYQNISTPGSPLFAALPGASSGLVHPTLMDEGAALFDYDLDGDFDLFAAYVDAAVGATLFESRGDGSFLQAEDGIIDSPWLGAGLGLSAEDWDCDGDVDFSTRQVFRRNQLLELGTRKFTVGLTPIPAVYSFSATPAWADWDLDGDLDLALGNYLSTGSFWTNTSWDPGAVSDVRRDVRVLALDDAPAAPGGGTTTAYGAAVELRLAGEGDSPGGGPLRRRKFTASSHGYLNQNEYALTFFLPPDPAPDDPLADQVFDLVVDFPGTAGTLRRIDPRVNPALGGLSLATLASREISVMRSGRVRVDGEQFEPAPHQPRDLSTTSGGLQLPSATAGVAPVVPAANPDTWVGAELDTTRASHPVQVREVILDGQLDGPAPCASPFNLALWDVTSPDSPVLVPGGTLATSTSSRNDRSFIAVDFTLAPGRRYRLVARVTSYRATNATSPASAALVAAGGLNFRDVSPCSGATMAVAPLLPSRAYLAVRWGEQPFTEWTTLGGGLAGSAGVPALSVKGELVIGQSVTVALSGAASFAPTWLILGLSVANQPFKGGTLVPEPLLGLGGLATGAAGKLQLSGTLDGSVPSGTTVVMQAWMLDAGGPQGAAASNGVLGSAP